MKNNITLIYNVCLVVGDFLALVAAFVVAYLLRVKFNVGLNSADIGPSNGRAFLNVFIGVAPAWIVVFAMLRLYNSSIYEKRFQEFGRLLVGSFVGMLIAIFWHFMAGDDVFPARLVPVYGFVFAFLFLLVFRNMARLVRSRLFTYGKGLTNVVLIGNTDMTREFIDWLSDQRSGYRVVAVVGGKRSQSKRFPVPLYASFDRFLAVYKGELNGIIQTELYADEARNAKILNYAQENHVDFRFVPGNTELFTGNLEVELFRSSIPVITVHQTALFGWGRVVKRLFDLVVGTVAFVAALPLLVVIAAIIKVSEPKAPVFYKPRRLGRFGAKFAFFKFRTMYWKYCTTPEEGFKRMGRPDLLEQYRKNGDQLPNDPRVTPIGRFLRRTSLDELPQLANVVMGQLSLVGPRALDPIDVEKYDKRNLILAVKTGLTGLAVVSGRRDISFEERRKLDLYYVQNWSLWLDIMILIKTVRVVLSARGAK